MVSINIFFYNHDSYPQEEPLPQAECCSLAEVRLQSQQPSSSAPVILVQIARKLARLGSGEKITAEKP